MSNNTTWSSVACFDKYGVLNWLFSNCFFCCYFRNLSSKTKINFLRNRKTTCFGLFLFFTGLFFIVLWISIYLKLQIDIATCGISVVGFELAIVYSLIIHFPHERKNSSEKEAERKKIAEIRASLENKMMRS